MKERLWSVFGGFGAASTLLSRNDGKKLLPCLPAYLAGGSPQKKLLLFLLSFLGPGVVLSFSFLRLVMDDAWARAESSSTFFVRDFWNSLPKSSDFVLGVTSEEYFIQDGSIASRIFPLLASETSCLIDKGCIESLT